LGGEMGLWWVDTEEVMVVVAVAAGNPQTESKGKLDRAGPASLVMLDPISTLKGPISGSAGAWGGAWGVGGWGSGGWCGGGA
jgi:hypothetical protein